MDLPLCKICGERHRLGFCPKFGDPASERRRWLRAMTGPARAEPVATVTPKPPIQQPVTPVKEDPDEAETARPSEVEQHHQAQAPEEETPPQAKLKFDKKAYQRDLMRKRRAKEKDKAKEAASWRTL